MTKVEHWYRYLKNAHLRLGKTGTQSDGVRSSFQRDFDRIVFAEPFRQLQNKTQVLPFPDRESIRNRLTHSLETSSVGRSLGYMLGEYLQQQYPALMEELNMDANDFAFMVAAAALAHDIGNPPFGHQGEVAISSFFRSPEAEPYMENLTDKQRADLQNFEGNAAGFHILSHTIDPRSPFRGGLRLSLGTYGAFVKYPKESLPVRKDEGRKSLKKYGFFQAGAETFEEIAQALHLIPQHSLGGKAWKRHPLVFLTEAADDICYSIIDLEDGYHLDRIGYDHIFGLLDPLIRTGKMPENYASYLNKIPGDRQRIAYMRATAINTLVHLVVDAFRQNEEEILNGNFDKSLTSVLPLPTRNILKEIEKVSIQRIYHHPAVLEKEAAGKNILPFLLKKFTAAVFHPDKHKQYYLLMPEAFRQAAEGDNDYHKLLYTALYIGSLSDRQAVRSYRKWHGAEGEW